VKHEWNEALAAFDRELPLLKALRAEYDAYLRERLELAMAKVSPELAGRAEVEVTVEDDEVGLSLHPLGPLKEATIDFRMWPAAGYGGERGKLRWGLYVQRQPGEGFPALPTVLARARQASDALPTERIADAPADVLEAGPAECIRWGHLDLAAPDLASQIATRLSGALVAALSASEAVLALRVTTPRSWLESILKEMKASGEFKQEGALDVRYGSWTPGMTLNVRPTADDYGWFTPWTDGRLAFHWDAPAAQRAARRSAVRDALGSPPALDQPRYDGVVLLSATDVAALQERDARADVRALASATWRKYRDVCTGG
jgi:hypothetical protein